MEHTTRKPKYVTVTTVASESVPGKTYTIKRHVETGELSCNCPSWIYAPRVAGVKRECKHLRKLNARVEQARTLADILNVLNPPPGQVAPVGAV